jgi:hypothetical protein
MVVLVGGLGANAISNLNGLARRGLTAHAWVIALAPWHWILLSAAAWRSVWQLCRDPYRWEKTEHGLARTSRRVPIPDTNTRNIFADRRRPRRRSA